MQPITLIAIKHFRAERCLPYRAALRYTGPQAARARFDESKQPPRCRRGGAVERVSEPQLTGALALVSAMARYTAGGNRTAQCHSTLGSDLPELSSIGRSVRIAMPAGGSGAELRTRGLRHIVLPILLGSARSGPATMRCGKLRKAAAVVPNSAGTALSENRLATTAHAKRGERALMGPSAVGLVPLRLPLTRSRTRGAATPLTGTGPLRHRSRTSIRVNDQSVL
jgi:hypothetical protein